VRDILVLYQFYQLYFNEIPGDTTLIRWANLIHWKQCVHETRIFIGTFGWCLIQGFGAAFLILNNRSRTIWRVGFTGKITSRLRLAARSYQHRFDRML